jgi:aspartyl-tRNA(Asn)/glutamyl-tRNA(Gln) amidotransferase subunit A
MTVDLDTITIETFAREWRADRISAVELTEHCLRRIDAINPRLNAFTLVMAEEARQQARQADRDLASGTDLGPLQGVPISVKDLIDIRGTPTTAASLVRNGHVAREDAPIIARLREAGAVFIGKTNLHEFAYGATNEDSSFGPTLNPFDPCRSPGGSSGGSAVSVATGMALASLGTDTGGSIRIPAAACGTVGLKPTHGEVPAEGIVPLSRTLEDAGPLARSVLDAWLVYRRLVGSLAREDCNPRPARGLRLAILRAHFCDVLDSDVRSRFEGVVEGLRKAGARVAEVEFPSVDLVTTIFEFIKAPEATAYHARTLEAVPDLYTRPVRLRLELGHYVLAEDYVRALNGREVLRQGLEAVLSDHDALVLPTLPVPAQPIGAEWVVVDGSKHPLRPLTMKLTQPFNITGHPAISLPCGLTSEGLPCGLQLVGRYQQTEALLGVALACEGQIGRLALTGVGSAVAAEEQRVPPSSARG